MIGVDKSIQTDPIQQDDNLRREEEEENEKADASHNEQKTTVSSNEQQGCSSFHCDIDNLSYIEHYFNMDFIVPLGELEHPY